MARIKIELPEKFIFSTEIPIIINYIDRGNHLSYDSILPMMEEARIRFMQSIDYPQENINGVGFIVTDVAVVYIKPGRHGQVLKIELTPTDFSSKGCDFLYRISDSETGEEIARAKMGVVFFDYPGHKIVTVPEVFINIVHQLG
ncbi:acyl-CoA thioesterase [Chloroflexota bacterium]